MMGSARHAGDDGESTLLDGTRLPKDHAIFEALGAVDELGAALGVARAALAASGDAAGAAAILAAQRVLVRIGSQIAAPPGSTAQGRMDGISEVDLTAIEDLERASSRDVPAPRGFVLPGASAPEAAVHVARASCRTAERRVVSCMRAGASHLATAQRYLNRLSAWLYWLALRHGSDT